MSASQQPDNPFGGMALMVLAMSFIPIIDICAQLLSESLSVFQVAWSRFFFHILWLVPVILSKRQSWGQLRSYWRLHLTRGLLLVSATVCFFNAIAVNPLPTALSLLFISPLVVALFAPLVLDEKFMPSRLLAAAVGFIGVLIVLQPDGEFRPSLLFAVMAGFCFAGYLLFTRKLPASASSLLSMLAIGIVGVTALAPLLPMVWQSPSWYELGLMASMGLVAMLGHYLILLACRLAEASLVAPFTYSEIVSATVLSYLIFGTWPQMQLWVGMIVICSSGIYVYVAEIRARKKVAAMETIP